MDREIKELEGKKDFDKILGKFPKHGMFIIAPDANPNFVNVRVNCFFSGVESVR